ncbi:gfo/Idh/MocA family oxidoreductase [bacterium]|nr:gfo/Idh/MocA family oxidoreductase [bacterium]NBX83697.1 gfo/Idh/MocA family oxidoreductase [bacterium]
MARIQPYIVGSGAASRALQNSIGIVSTLHPEWNIQKPIHVKRDQSLKTLQPGKESVLFLANPHALHTRYLLEAQAAGFSWVVCEKPAAVNAEQVKELSQVKIPVAVCHGYRQTWGIQTLKKMLEQGELGAWITIEGCYWQSSAAEKKLSGDRATTWKDDTALSGNYDVLLDLGTHWTDLVFFLAGELPLKTSVWKSFANTTSSHRDTHNLIAMEFKGERRAFGSVSKTVHGCGNDLEIHVIGEKKTVSWAFMNPDQLVIGEGGDRRTVHRPGNSLFGSQQYPFHSTGWLEGYVEIIKQYFRQMRGESYEPYPTLAEQRAVLGAILGH